MCGVFVVEMRQKFVGENFSKKFSAEMKFCSLDPWKVELSVQNRMLQRRHRAALERHRTRDLQFVASG
jgi:hypothetical protein